MYIHHQETVSIQLGSPASGDVLFPLLLSKEDNVSIQLGSPASGDLGFISIWGAGCCRVSIQLGSPASGDLFLSVNRYLHP